MATSQFYVDETTPANSGTGTTGDPYLSLAYAFSQNSNVPSGDGFYFNIKGASSTGTAITSFGTFPTKGGSNSATVLGIRPWVTTPGEFDVTDLVYFDGGGISTKVWTDTVTDYVDFINCHFFNHTSEFFQLDRNVTFWNCTFDGCTPKMNVNARAMYSSFINQTGSKSSFSSYLGSQCIGCLFHRTGTGTTDMVSCQFVSNCVFISDTSAGAFVVCYSASNTIDNNTFAYKSGITTGKAIKSSRAAYISNNYFENCEYGIYCETAQASHAVSNNAFYGVTNQLGNDSATPNTNSMNSTVLGFSGLEDLANDDYLPSATLITANAAMDSPLPWGSIDSPFFGAIPSPAGGGGGGSYIHIPRIRTIT